MTIKINVKWPNGKTTLENVELDIDKSPIILREKLTSLTGVPIDRQRIMFKGKVIKDSWPDDLNVTEGATLMLMGSSEKLPEAPVEKPKFIEDLSENELAAALDIPAGLTNLGNTCYMSATIQCLKTVPELRESLNRCDAKLPLLATLTHGPSNENLTAALSLLYKEMDKSAVVEPFIMLKTLHNSMPRFAQRGEGNAFQQQDANECWTEITRILQQTLKPLAENSKYSNVIDEYFKGMLETEMKCEEAEDETPTKAEEDFLQLSCFISQDVRYLQSGLISRMKETITKSSPTLGRDALYTKVSRISRLPAYLTIQFVRFHYKENVQTNAKLLRDVKFSMVLDVYDLCTEELKQKLAPMRAKFKKVDEPKTESAEPESASSDVTMATESAGTSYETTSFPEDPGSNNSGFYELKAVLTHQGRSSASGHYVAWIKRDNQWFKCDDDLVSPVEPDEILKLSGGGDWHCAYLCLYGPCLPSDHSTFIIQS